MLPEEFQLPYEEICPFAISDGCGYNGSMQTIDRLFSFIGKSPSPYHAVDTAAGILAGKGFTELREDTPFAIRRGGRYYIKRAGTALIAFIVPSDPRSFSIIAAHTDSPCFPSDADDDMTKKVQVICNLNNVRLYDHCIFAPDGIYSYFLTNRLDDIAREYSVSNLFGKNF